MDDVIPRPPPCPQRRVGEPLEVTVVKADECIHLKTRAIEAGRGNYAGVAKDYGAR